MKIETDLQYQTKQEVTNGAPWSLSKCWECVIYQYGLPLLHYCINIMYAVYTNCTALNVVRNKYLPKLFDPIAYWPCRVYTVEFDSRVFSPVVNFYTTVLFFVKIVPTGMYVGNLVRNIYVTSRDRLRLNQRELEDLQLQIQIINTKIRLRDAEFVDRTEELRKDTEKFRKVRARVREVIAADEELRRSLHEAVLWEDPDIHVDSPLEEREFILQLLKELKYDQEAAGEGTETTEMNYEMRSPSDPTSLQEESIYSSASEADAKQNCRVKIVKVTNVYKVAYLKHFIKQKKLRRATKHAILKKKVETVKQFLEDWQKTLDMVINSKIAILNMDPRYVEVASQEAMGDYTKQDLRDFSETDSENRNFNDSYYEPVSNWTQNINRNFSSSFEDVPDPAVSRELNESSYGLHQCECYDQLGLNHQASKLDILPEETVSQMAIEEVRSEASDEYNCRDVLI